MADIIDYAEWQQRNQLRKEGLAMAQETAEKSYEQEVRNKVLRALEQGKEEVLIDRDDFIREELIDGYFFFQVGENICQEFQAAGYPMRKTAGPEYWSYGICWDTPEKQWHAFDLIPWVYNKIVQIVIGLSSK